MANPVWLLDIDGVVNALAREPVRDSWPTDDWAQHVVQADIPGSGPMVLPIFVANPVLDFIRATVAAGTVDVVWHSTWREAAVTSLAPALDLPAIPVSVAPEWTDRPRHLWWKLPAAQRVLGSGRRLIWTDDDIAVVGDQLAGVADHPDALLIAPARNVGLTREHLDRIREFVEQPPRARPRRGLARLLRR